MLARIMMHDPTEISIREAAGYGPPGGGPPGGGGWGPPPGGGAPPGGYGGPPAGGPPGYGPPGGGPPPGGGGPYGAPPAPPGFGGPPPPQGFGPPGGGFPPPGGPMLPAGGSGVNTTLPLVISIISIFCCGLGTIGGIIGIIFSIQAKSALDQGQVEDARGKAKIALLVSAICGGISLLGIIAYWLFVFVLVASEH